MKRSIVIGILAFLITLSVGLIGFEHKAEALSSKTRCFFLLYSDCFKTGDFTPDLSWNQSLVTLDYETYMFLREDLFPKGKYQSTGAWFQWAGSFFMHHLAYLVAAPGVGEEVPGLPVYGGSMSGTSKGEGFMVKTKKTGSSIEYPFCWQMKKVTKALASQCPGMKKDKDPIGNRSQRLDEDEEDEDQDEPEEPEEPDEPEEPEEPDDPEVIQGKFME